MRAARLAEVWDPPRQRPTATQLMGPTELPGLLLIGMCEPIVFTEFLFLLSIILLLFLLEDTLPCEALTAQTPF